MPRTEVDIIKIKQVFKHAFGVEDTPQVWYTIYSNIAGTPPITTRFSYTKIANIARRLDINKLLQDHKQLEYETHMATLEQKAEEKLKKDLRDANPDEPLMPSGPSDT